MMKLHVLCVEMATRGGLSHRFISPVYLGPVPTRHKSRYYTSVHVRVQLSRIVNRWPVRFAVSSYV